MEVCLLSCGCIFYLQALVCIATVQIQKDGYGDSGKMVFVQVMELVFTVIVVLTQAFDVEGGIG